jgi:integrase
MTMTKALVLTQNDIERIQKRTDEIDDIARQFTFAEYQLDKSPNTLLAQKRDLQKFMGFINAIFDADNLPFLTDLYQDSSQWQVVTDGIVRMFRVWLLDNGYAVSTVNRMTVTIKVYSRLAWHSGIMNGQYKRIDAIETFAKDVYIDEKRTKQGKDTRKSSEKKQANFLTDSQVNTLKASQGTLPINRRDELMISLLANLGVRASEVAELTVGNVDHTNKQITVYRRKTDTTDVLTYRHYDDLVSAIVAYMPYLLEDDNAPLLRASRTNGQLKDNAMTRITISKRVKTLGKKLLNIDNLSSHDLRHTFAKREYEQGSDVIAIRRAGGWKTTEMVDRYIGELEIANSGLKDNQNSEIGAQNMP